MMQIAGRSALLPAALAILLGAADWELARQLGTRREAWDDPLYWQLAYPLLLFSAFGFGLIWGERPWRWVACLIGGQAAWALVLALVHGGVPSLLPMGLLLFAVLGIPCLLAAYVGRWVGGMAIA
jgi:hypothetical protein